MPIETIAVLLVAAIAHAIWNTVSKSKRGDTVVFVWAYTLVSTLLCVPIGAALVGAGLQPIDGRLAVGSIVSAVLHLVYSLTLQTGYDRADLGVVYPVARGTGPVVTMVIAIALLGERPGWIAALGACVVVAGIVVVTGNPFSRRAGSKTASADRSAQRTSHPGRGVVWGTATGASIAAYTLWDDFSVTTLGLQPVAYYAGTLALQSLLLTPGALRRRGRIPALIGENLRPILIVAVLSPLAYVLVLTAMQHAPVALVAPLRESSIVIGSLLAWWLFREDHLARRIAGAAVVLVGIVTITV